VTEPNERLAGALADRYRIERELGAGGMATVYLAQDLKHDRRVAIKVLRPELSAVIGTERFLREIKTIANLSHPHILGLIDSGEVNGTAFYVMPFVDGESLRDRLTREKQLPVGDAVRLASEVAAALDYAHRHGVIHRDIKPENVLLHDGAALVADFGIALAVSSAGGSSRMTETGMSLGTPHYMSPEQAMGEREITARSDVYGLGAMTYEMLVGEPPFTGPTAQAIIAKVMTSEAPSITGQRRSVPPQVEWAVFTALEKLPADRFGTAAEFAQALKGDGSAVTRQRGSAVRVAEPPSRRATFRVVSGLAVAATLAALTLAVKAFSKPAPLPVTRLTLDLPDIRVNHTGYYGAAFALSPDGSRLAYVVGGHRSGQGYRNQLWVKERGDLQPRRIEGADGADGPFLSPDGAWIGFFVRGAMFKVPATGGTPVQLASDAGAVTPAGAWRDDGSIIYSDVNFGLSRVGADGGKSTVAAPSRDAGLFYPAILPDRDLILASICGNNCSRYQLVVVNLKTQVIDTVLANTSRGFYLANGFVVAVQSDGTLVGAPFDVGAHRLTRAPVALVAGVQRELGIMPEYAVANDGTLIYLPINATAGSATAAEVDRSGRSRILDPTWESRFSSVSLSPDGRRLAVSLNEVTGGTGGMLWVKQLDAGPLTRLTFDGGINYRAAWMPDGRTLSFSSDRTGPGTFLYKMRADGSGQPERLFPGDPAQVDEADWSRDGQWLAYRTGTVPGVRDVYARRLTGDSTPFPVSAGPADEYMPAISPDGRWIAYASLESGREEIYVRPFPDVTRARWQVTPTGGTNPVWAHSGRELFYVAPGDTLMAAAVAAGTDFNVTSRKALFSTVPFAFQPWHQSFGVRPGDQSFVLLRRSDAVDPVHRRLNVVLNWFTELDQQKAPAT
jgi:serine/threonine-protein kinase